MTAKNATITKEQAREELLNLTEQLGRVPTRDEFIKLNTLKGCHKQGISLLFGKNPYSSLLEYSGVNLNQQLKQPPVQVSCKECNTVFTKYANEIKRSLNHFCSNSCSATYNNKHKEFGCRRSKLEEHIEKVLSKDLPDLEVKYSSKVEINSELDVYIPSLKLAFEIQGIFHYEPIFGQEKLDQIQKNDLEKIQRCEELNIKLIHIDTRTQKRFTEKSSEKYLKEIFTEITKRSCEKLT